MAIHVGVDRNFFNRFVACKDRSVKAAVIGAFRSRRLTFHPTVELVDETIAAIGTNAVRDVPEQAKALLAMGGSFRRFWIEIVRTELLGHTSANEPVQKQREMRQFFRNLARGLQPGNVRPAITKEIEDKVDRALYYRAEKEHVHDARKKLAKRTNRNEKMSYEEFLRKCWSVEAPQLGEALCRAMQVNGASHRVQLALRNPERFPYFHAMLRAYGAMQYRYFIQPTHNSIEDGDFYDIGHVISAQGLDWFVSDDRKFLAEVFIRVHGNSRRLVAFDELTNDAIVTGETTIRD